MVRYASRRNNCRMRLIFEDGVPGLSQKAIQPGATFIYRWTAYQYGTYWYHGHSKGQLEDGLLGPIFIK